MDAYFITINLSRFESAISYSLFRVKTPRSTVCYNFTRRPCSSLLYVSPNTSLIESIPGALTLNDAVFDALSRSHSFTHGYAQHVRFLTLYAPMLHKSAIVACTVYVLTIRKLEWCKLPVFWNTIFLSSIVGYSRWRRDKCGCQPRHFDLG